MSLQSIAKNIAVNVAIDPLTLTTVLSNTDPSAVKIARFTAEAGEEIARRVNWGALQKTGTVNGTDNGDPIALPADFSRVPPGMSIRSGGAVVRTGLTSDEWNSLPATVGTPRFARFLGKAVSFWPYLPIGSTATITYQSLNWNTGGATWAADSDTPFFPEALVEKGALWRWRRNLGNDFQDQLAEFEAALVEMAKFDDAMRQP